MVLYYKFHITFADYYSLFDASFLALLEIRRRRLRGLGHVQPIVAKKRGRPKITWCRTSDDEAKRDGFILGPSTGQSMKQDPVAVSNCGLMSQMEGRGTKLET